MKASKMKGRRESSMSSLSTASESVESPDKDADVSSMFSGDHPLSSFSQVGGLQEVPGVLLKAHGPWLRLQLRWCELTGRD